MIMVNARALNNQLGISSLIQRELMLPLSQLKAFCMPLQFTYTRTSSHFRVESIAPNFHFLS